MTQSPYLDWLAGSLAVRPPRTRPVAADADMILGYATGYGVPEIAPFVRSLRAVFSGPVALVVDPGDELSAFLASHDVEAVVPSGRGTSWTPHVVVERFSAYPAVLEQRPWVRNVVITDVRDVVFQSDPFADPIAGLEFFEENEGQPLAAHAFNVKHLRALAGERLAQTILDRACVCVGVVAGPREEVIRFCRALLMLCAIPRSKVGGAFGADQAACNIIAHFGLLGGSVRRNYERVATIGLTPERRLRLEEGRIMNPDASFSPIVHQYDRTRFLAEHVDGRWRDGVIVARDHGRPRRSTRLRASLLRRLPELR